MVQIHRRGGCALRVMRFALTAARDHHGRGQKQ